MNRPGPRKMFFCNKDECGLETGQVIFFTKFMNVVLFVKFSKSLRGIVFG